MSEVLYNCIYFHSKQPTTFDNAFILSLGKKVIFKNLCLFHLKKKQYLFLIY